jgi:hypothetical protein
MLAASVEPIPVTAASAPIPRMTRSFLRGFGAGLLLSSAPPRFKISTRFLHDFYCREPISLFAWQYLITLGVKWVVISSVDLGKHWVTAGKQLTTNKKPPASLFPTKRVVLVI